MLLFGAQGAGWSKRSKLEGLRAYKGLVAEFISPTKCTLSVFIVGNIIPRSVKCIHSATKKGLAVGGKGCAKTGSGFRSLSSGLVVEFGVCFRVCRDLVCHKGFIGIIIKVCILVSALSTIQRP